MILSYNPMLIEYRQCSNQ